MTPVKHEGWTNFAGQARKFHFIPSDDTRALCGKWAISPFQPEDQVRAVLQADTGSGPDDCVACRRALDKRNA